jgi:UDP-hydrolysing UDP-N-acetyl-D-glucosamine 2-epimerase
MKKKVCVVIGSRANYSSIKSACRSIARHPDLDLQVVVGASAVLDRYGAVEKLIKADGFMPAARVFMLVEGETPVTMAKSTGMGLMELATIFDTLAPDVVLTVGDRFETMATALAAAYLNIPLAHTMGGEVSGNIDETVRHAITKLAHIHFPACDDAAERIRKMGEEEDRIHMVGCPRIDLISEILQDPEPSDLRDIFREGVGGDLSLDDPFVLVSQHPVTYEYGDGETQMQTTLDAVSEVGLPAIVLWPNADAGSEYVARGIRKYREQHSRLNMHFFKNLPIHHYVWLMRKTACLVGNSSSGIREGAYIGTPSVNIGSRQEGRQRGQNVIDVGYDRDAIAAAIRRNREIGPRPMEPIYGDGAAGVRIADILAGTVIEIQKRMTY